MNSSAISMDSGTYQVPTHDEDEKELEIETSYIKVEGHLLKWKERLIQIRNIESVSYWIHHVSFKAKKEAELLEIQGNKMVEKGSLLEQEGIEDYEKAEADYNIPCFLFKMGKALSINAIICFVIRLFISKWLKVLITLLFILSIGIGLFLLLSNRNALHEGERAKREANLKISNGKNQVAKGNQMISLAKEKLAEWEKYRKKAEQENFLRIYMISGYRYEIQFRNATLLKAVFGVLSNVFANESKVKPFDINIKANKIAGIPVEEQKNEQEDDDEENDKYVTVIVNQVINSTFRGGSTNIGRDTITQL